MVQAAITSKQASVGNTTLRVCPFCGTTNEDRNACARCTLEDSPSMRAATKARIGPWFVLQTRNPAAPGMKFETLGLLIRKGLVTAQSVVRGPTTHQLWQWAAKVKGISREFGLCYSCGEAIEKTDALCGHCNRSQLPPADVDGLLDVSTAPPASDASEEKAEAGEVSEPSATTDNVAGIEQDDILSVRELAMVFQLDYGPPVEAKEAPVPQNRTKIVVAAILLLISACAMVTWSLLRSYPKNAGTGVVLVSPAPAIAAPLHPPVLVPITATTQPTTRPAAAASPSVNQSRPEFDVRGMWNKALEAESRRDFATAFKIYRQIQQQPAQTWPTGLQTRLELARREMTTGTN